MDLPHRMHPPLRAQDLRAKPGYYLQCFPQPGGFWRRPEPLPRPDARFGFPWTVKDWEKRQRKAGEDIAGDLLADFEGSFQEVVFPEMGGSPTP